MSKKKFYKMNLSLVTSKFLPLKIWSEKDASRRGVLCCEKREGWGGGGAGNGVFFIILVEKVFVREDSRKEKRKKESANASLGQQAHLIFV